jgi:Uma2 family endonuclease
MVGGAQANVKTIGKQVELLTPDPNTAGDFVVAVFTASAIKATSFLAAPRALARAALGIRGYPTPDSLYGTIEVCVLAFGGALHQTPAAQQLRHLLTVMEPWDADFEAPADVVSAARQLLTTLGANEPAGGWDSWTGPIEEAPPNAPVTFRPLQDGFMSAEQWLEHTGEGELADGILIEEEDATPLHDVAVKFLFETLHSWAKEHGALVLGPEHKLVIHESYGRRPDISVYRQNAILDIPSALSRRPPALIIEVISPSRNDHVRDLYLKARDYARVGVEHYWCIEPVERWMQCLTLRPKRRWTLPSGTDCGCVTLAELDGLTVDLDALWKRIDAHLGKSI